MASNTCNNRILDKRRNWNKLTEAEKKEKLKQAMSNIIGQGQIEFETGKK